MPRSYRHISKYEDEILEMRRQGKTRKEICEKLGFTLRQVKDFITRYNQKQKKLASGISIKPKGRPRKNGTSSNQSRNHFVATRSYASLIN